MLAFLDLSPVGERLVALATKIGAEVAAVHAVDVDRNGRFPAEAIAALADARMLSSFVPTELGGEGATMTDIVAACHVLGMYCSSTAMVFAMHQIQVACLVHHGLESTELREHLRLLAAEQRLQASATTEVGTGGDVRSSVCAVASNGTTYRLRKETPVISYGDYAQDILVTARRHADAPAADQVIVVVRRSDAELVPTSDWDALGMRGTCSRGFVLTAEGPIGHVLSTPYAEISARTMLPVSHLVWAGLWSGIATDAVRQVRASLRKQARKSGGVPSSAPDVAMLHADLELVRSAIAATTQLYERVRMDPAAATTPSMTLRMNALKVSVSLALPRIVTDALRLGGINAYRNDSEQSLGRHLRDLHSAALMVHNERILANNGSLLCVTKDDV
jgi:acyl-CoA dehydrogenase